MGGLGGRLGWAAPMGCRKRGKGSVLQAESVDYQINGVTILSDVSVHVRPGELWGVIGPNGAGKTTLMRLMAGLSRPTRGEVRFEGTPLHALADRERARSIAVVSQSAHAGFGFTVYDVVSMGRYPHKGRFAPLSPADREAIDRALQATDLLHLTERRLPELSGGERQRVFIARALAQQPRLLFLDEPTANLDVRYQIEILRLVKSLNERMGLTVVMAIHDLTWALRFCSHLAALKGGRVLAQGPATTALTPELIEQAFGVLGRVVYEPGAPVRVEIDDTVSQAH